ncbi:MAG: hypothetical protein R2706_19010 [Acidimicrobiales bacterium]
MGRASPSRSLTTDDRLRKGKAVNPNRLLVVEAFLILLLPIILLVVDVDFSQGANLIDYPALMIGASQWEYRRQPQTSRRHRRCHYLRHGHDRAHW